MSVDLDRVLVESLAEKLKQSMLSIAPYPTCNTKVAYLDNGDLVLKVYCYTEDKGDAEDYIYCSRTGRVYVSRAGDKITFMHASVKARDTKTLVESMRRAQQIIQLFTRT